MSSPQVFTCPVCAGSGTVGKPPWLVGDITIWNGSNTELYICHVCKGIGILSIQQIK